MDINELEEIIERFRASYIALAQQAKESEDNELVDTYLRDRTIIYNLCIAGLYAYEFKASIQQIMSIQSLE